jgi:hypothetical protein
MAMIIFLQLMRYICNFYFVLATIWVIFMFWAQPTMSNNQDEDMKWNQVNMNITLDGNYNQDDNTIIYMPLQRNKCHVFPKLKKG